MNILYNIGIYCYKVLVSFAACFNNKAKKLSQGQKLSFGHIIQSTPQEGYDLWIHASSLGEFEQGRPLIESIRKQYPQYRILLTFFSPSGYEVRKNYNGVDCVCYLPFDTPYNAQKFISITKPRKVIFIKYDFWSNYLHELKRRHIDTYIISAIFRPSQMFFKPLGGFFRNMLHCFTHLYVQDDASRKLLANIGISNVTVAGDTRFDRVSEIYHQAKELPLIAAFTQNHFTWIAGSSWQADEEIFIPYFNNQPTQRLIIAPHEIDEEHLQQIEKLLTRPSLRLSQANHENINQADCLIIDSFGLLSSIYRYGKIAYIGGGFGAGIHNILEAAVYGIPIIFGSNYKKFREARQMIDLKCAFSIAQYQEFTLCMDKLTSSPSYLTSVGNQAGRYVIEHTGATQLIFSRIFAH